MTNRLTIKRTHSSPYFSSHFHESEKMALNVLAEVIPFESTNSHLLADVNITNTHTDFHLFSTHEIEKVKLIIHPNSGYDNFPLEFVKSCKAPIIIGNSIRAQAVAQYTLSALYHHLAEIPIQHTWNASRKWPRKLLSDLNITIVGFGHIGKIIHRSLSPMAGQISIYDPFENYPNLNCQNSDVIIFSCGLNSTNHHMADKNFFKNLREDVLIINPARGNLIKTSDLIDFLKANPQAHAVLDVFEEEPCDFSLFYNTHQLTNITTTSHIAGVYTNIDQATIDFEVASLKDFLTLPENEFKNKYQKMILQNKLHADIGLI